MEEYLFNNSTLPPDLYARVRSEMQDGERLMWVGQPRPARAARESIPIVLFGIPWTAFAIFWMAVTAGILFGGKQKPGMGGVAVLFACFPLFGLPFVVIGLGLLSSPYWVWRQSKRTCYALTDRRAILWQAGLWKNVEVRSFEPKALGKLVRNEYSDGSGDLVFEEITTVGSDGSGHRTTRTARRGFMAIDDVHGVEELLQRTLLKTEAKSD